MPVVDTVMQFRGTETVTPTAANINNALRSLEAQAIASGQAMANAGFKGASGFDKLREKIVYTTDAAGNAQAKIIATSGAVNASSQAADGAQKSWADYAKGVFAGVGVYTLVSSALREIKSALSAVGEAAIGLNAKLEQARIGFTTLLGSVQLADSFLKELYQFALKTPFQFPDLIDATKRILAFGFTMKEVIPIMTAVGNASAALGTGALGIDRMTLALGQMAAKGKVQGQEIKQLAEAGIRTIDIYAILADKFGVSVQEIIAWQEQGKLKSKDFIAAFMEYSKLKFGDMMALQVKTFLGAVSNIKDASQMIIAAGFEPIFKRMSAAVYEFSTTLTSSKADEYIGKIRGASEKFLDIVDKVSAALKGNLNPTLAALGAVIAVILVPALIKLSISLLALSINPVSLAFGALALVVFKLTQYLEKNPEAARKVANALRMIGDFARENVLPFLERLIDGLRVVIEWLNRVGHAFGDFSRNLLEWTGTNKKAETSSKNLPIILKKTEEALGPLISAWDAQNIMLKEAASFSDNFRDALGDLAGEITLTKDEVDDYEDAIVKTFDKMADAMVSSKEVAVDWANKFKQKLGITIVPVDDLKKKIELLGSAMVGLSADEKMYFARRINEVMSGMTSTIDGVKLATEGLVGILNQVNTAAEQAAQTKRWEDMWQAFSGGIADVFGEFEKIKEKQIGGIFAPGEIEKERLDVQGMEADLATVEEQIRRIQGVSSATDLNWKFPDPTKLKELGAKAGELRIKIGEVNGTIKDQVAWNDQLGARTKAAYQACIAALGEYMAKWVVAQELQGNLTKDQADVLLAYYEKTFGASLSIADALTREIKNYSGDILRYGQNGYLALGLIVKGAGEAALAGKDVGTAFKSGMADWQTVLQEGLSVFGKYGKIGVDAFDELIQKALQSEKPIGAITQGIEDFKVKMGEISGEGEAADKLLRKMGELPAKGLKPIVDAAVALKTPFQTAAEDNADAYADAMVTKIKGRIKDIEDVGAGIISGLSSGMTSPASQAMLNNATATVVSWLPAWARQLLGMGSPSRVFADIGLGIMQGLAQGIQGAGELPVQALIDQIQRLLDLFGGLHVPSYIGELADSVNSVVSAFKTALEALSLLENYTPAAVSSVEQAYYDMKRIINAFVEAYTLWGTWIDLEKFQQLADIANSLMGAFKTGLEALSQLKEYTSPARSAIDAAVEDMIYLVQKLQDGISPLMEGVGKSLAAIGEGVGAIIEPLVKLRSYIGIIRDKVSGIAPALDAFQTDLTDLSQRLSQLAIWLAGQKDLTEKMQSFGETLQAIGGGVGSIIEPLMKLHDYVGMARVASSGVAPALQAFEIDLRGLFGRLAVLAQWVADQGDLADQMRILGETLAAIMEPINTAIDVLNKIAMYIALPRDAGGIAPALEAFDTDLRGLIGRLGTIADALGIVDVLSPMRVKLIAFGEVMQAIMPPLMDAFEILDALREYIPLERVGAGGIAPALEAFETDLRGLLGRLGTIADVIGILDPTVVNKLKELGAVLVAVMEGVRSTIQTLTDLMKWTATAPTWTELLAALDSLDSVLDGFISYMEIWATTIDIPPGMLDFADKLGRIVAPFQSVVSIFSSLIDLGEKLAGKTFDLVTLMNWLDSITRELVARVRFWMEGIDPLVIGESLANYAKLLGEIISPFSSIISVVTGAVELAKKLAEGTIDLITATTLLDTATRELVKTITAWAGTGEGAIDIGVIDSETNPLALYAKTLSAILSPMQTAISITSGAIDLAKKIGEGAYSFINAMTVLREAVARLVDAMEIMKNDIPLTGKPAEALIAYAELLAKVLSPMQTAISITSAALDLAEKVKKGTADLTQTMTILREAVARVVDAVIILQTDVPLDTEADKPLLAYAEMLSKILSPMQSVISITSAALDLAEKLGDDGVSFTNAIVHMTNAAQGLVIALTGWQELIPLSIDAASPEPLVAYADVLGKVLSPMQTVISITTAAIDLAKKMGSGSVSFTNAIITMTNAASGLVVAMTDWQTTIPLDTDPATNMLLPYAEMLGNILSPMSTVISITSSALDLTEKLGGATQEFTEVIYVIGAATQALIEAITEWQTTIPLDTDPITNTLAPYAEMLSSILSPMQAVVSITSSAIDLVEKVGEDSLALTNAIATMTSVATELVSTLVGWTDVIDIGDLDPAENALLPFAEMLSKLLSPMSTVISITSGMIDLVEKVGDSEAILTRALIQMTNVAGELVRTIISWADTINIGDLDPTENTLLPFIEMLSKILSPMQTVISITTSMIDLVEKVGDNEFILVRSMAALTNIAGELIRTLTGWVDVIDVGDLDPVKNALLPFAEMLSRLLAPMQTVISITSSVIDLAIKIEEEEFTLVSVFELLTGVAQALIDELEYWEESLDIGDLDPAKNALLPFSEMLSKLLVPMQTVVSITSSVVDLATKIEEQEFTLVSVFELLTSAAQALIEKLRYWEESLDIGDLDPTKNVLLPYAEMLSKLLAPMQTVISVTSGAVDLAEQVAEVEGTLENAILFMARAASGLTTALITWKNTIPIGSLDPEENQFLPYAQMLDMLLAPMQTIISVTSSAVDLAAQVAETEGTLENAILFMARAASGLTTALITWSRTIPIGSLDPEENQFLPYATMLSALLEPMQTIISVTSGAIDLAEKCAEVEGTLDNAILFMARAASGLTTALITWKLTIPIGSLDPEENQFLPYAKMLSALLEPMQTIISVTSAAIDLAARCADVEGTLENAILFITRAMSGLITALITWKNTIPIGDLDPKKNIFLPYAEMLSALLTPMQTVISITSGALDLASKVAEGTADLDAAMTVLTQATIALVDTLRELQTNLPLDKVTDKALLVYSELLANILSPLSTVISIVTGALDLADHVSKGTADITKAMTTLVQSAVALVRTLNLMRSMFLPMEEISDKALLAYAETLSKVLSPFSTIISVVTSALDLADRVAKGISEINLAIVALVQAATALVRTLNLMRSMFLPMSEIADEALLLYAETLFAVLSPLSTIMSITSSALDLSDRVAKGTGNIAAAMTVMVQAAVALIRTLNLMRVMFLPMGEIADEALRLYAETLTAVLSPLSTVMSITTSTLDLADRISAGTADIATAMVIMVQAALALVRTLNLMRTMFLPMSEIADEAFLLYAMTLSAILSPLSTIMSITSSALDLADRVAKGTADITRAMIVLVQSAVALVRTLNLMRTMFLPMSEVVDEALLLYAETLSAVLSPLSTVMSITGSALDLSDRVAKGTADIAAAMVIMIQAAQALVRTLNLMRIMFLPITEIADEALQLYIETLSAVLSPLSAIMSITSNALDLADRVSKGAGDLVQAMIIMVQSAQALVRTLNLMRIMFLPMEEISDEALRLYIETLSAVLSPLSAITSITSNALDLADRVAEGTSDLVPAMTAITDAATQLVTTLRSLVTSLPVQLPIDQPLLDYATVLSAALNPLSTIISVTTSAIDLAVKVSEGTVGMETAMEQIMLSAVGLVDTLRQLMIMLPLSAATDQALLDYADLLSRILSPLSTIMSITGNAYDLADRVAKGTLNLQAAMDQMRDAAFYLVNAMRMLAVDIPLDVTTDASLLDYADLLSRILSPMSTIISITINALDLADRVAAGTLNLQTAMDQMRDAAFYLVSAIRTLSQDVPLDVTVDKALVDYATTLAAVVSPLSTIMSITTDALDLADRVAKGTADIGAAMTQMRESAGQLVSALRALSHEVPLDTVADETLVNYATLLSSILSPLSTVMSITTNALDLASRVASGTVNLSAAMIQMREAAWRLVDAVRTLARDVPIDVTADQALVDYATLLGNIVSPLSTVMSITTAAMDLAGHVISGTINIADAMTQMRDAAWQLVEAVRIMANDIPLDVVRDASLLAYANLLGQLLSPLSTVMSTTTAAFDLADRVAKGTGDILQAMNIMREAVARIVDAMAMLKNDVPVEPDLIEYATRLGNLLQPMSTVLSITSSAIDLAEKIVDKTFTWSTVVGVIETATRALYDMITGWFDAGEMNPTDEMVAYAERLSKFLAPLQAVITITDAMFSLSEKIADGTINLAKMMRLIREVTGQLVGLITQWSSTGKGGLIITQAMVDYSVMLGAVLAPIQTAISVVSSIVDLSEKLGTRTIDWVTITQRLAGAVMALMDAWHRVLTPAFLAALAAFPEDFGNALNNALSPIKNAVDALMAIHSYIGFARISADDIPSRIQALADDVRSFMLAFAAAASYIADPAPITAFGAALNAIIGPIKTYIDTFYWLWRYRSIAERSGGRGRPPGWIPPQFEAIANDVRLFVLAMSRLAAEIEPDALAAAAAFSTSIQPLFTMAGDVLDFFARIVSRPRASLGGVINRFVEDLTYAVRQLVAGFSEAGSIAEALQTAMDVIGFQGGVTLIDALIRGIGSRMEALDFALDALVFHINASLQGGLAEASALAGGIGDMPAAAPARNVAPQNYEVNITFAGPIYANRPEDVERLAQRVAQVLGERATNYRNIVVPSY